MWWIIIITCLLVVFIYLFFAPFFIEINSDTGSYILRFHRLASANLSFNENTIYLKLKIALWQKQIDLLEVKKKEKIPLVKKEKKKSKKIPFQKMFAVIKSFRINKFYLTVDTGNMQTNGILFPVFALMNIGIGKNITINFLDENKLILQIENNLARITWAYIKS